MKQSVLGAILMVLAGCNNQAGIWQTDQLLVVADKLVEDPGFRANEPVVRLPVRTMDELFKLESVIALEFLDEAVIGEVTDVLHFDQHWYVLDQMTCSVFKFSHDGQFINRFGKRGTGAGEFEYPKRLRRCFNNYIGVCDPVQGRIHLFDEQGQFVREIQPVFDGEIMAPRFSFVWNHESQLVISSFKTNNSHAPVHAALDGSVIPSRLRFGFGKRHQVIEKAVARGMARRAYTAFEEIDGRYWAGSPYTTYIDVFNKEGQRLGRLGEKGTRNHDILVSLNDYANLKLNENPARVMALRALKRKRGNDLIYSIGDWVFVRMGRIYDVYRKNGQQIANNLIAHNIVMNYAFKDYLVMTIPAGLDLNTMDESELKVRLLQKGYDPKDNPFLVIFKLNPQSDLG